MSRFKIPDETIGSLKQTGRCGQVGACLSGTHCIVGGVTILHELGDAAQTPCIISVVSAHLHIAYP
jgi:hypothetical protein